MTRISLPTLRTEMHLCIPQNRIDLILEVLEISENILRKLMEAAPYLES